MSKTTTTLRKIAYEELLFFIAIFNFHGSRRYKTVGITSTAPPLLPLTSPTREPRGSQCPVSFLPVGWTSHMVQNNCHPDLTSLTAEVPNPGLSFRSSRL